jgi:hypothetical protein
MRLHRLLIAVSLLCGGLASAQTALDQTKEASARPKKDAMPHAPLFVEQKDAPTMAKTAAAPAPRVGSKSKD